MERIILFCFNGAWTTLFGSTYLLWLVRYLSSGLYASSRRDHLSLWQVDGAGHILANVVSSLAWLLVTSVLWVKLF